MDPWIRWKAFTEGKLKPKGDMTDLEKLQVFHGGLNQSFFFLIFNLRSKKEVKVYARTNRI